MRVVGRTNARNARDSWSAWEWFCFCGLLAASHTIARPCAALARARWLAPARWWPKFKTYASFEFGPGASRFRQTVAPSCVTRHRTTVVRIAAAPQSAATTEWLRRERQTISDLKRNRREAAGERFLCAIQLCTVQRMSSARGNSARGANKQISKTREIRGRQGLWLCFCARQALADSNSWSMLPMEWLSGAVSASSSSLFKKRASCSCRPSAPSSGPEIAMISTLHACDMKPHLVAARTVVGIIE
jgi:hypothetical protein